MNLDLALLGRCSGQSGVGGPIGEQVRTLWLTGTMIDGYMGRMRYSGGSNSFYSLELEKSA